MHAHRHVCLKSIESFFVAGRSVRVDGLPIEHRSMVLNGAPREVNPNGSHTFGQMYVQCFKQVDPKYPQPLMLWHGGGMTGASWEATPDGRPGWLWRFLQEGFDVYVCDAVERGRSSFAMNPQVYKEAPVFRTKEEGWTTFRLGPTYSDTPSERRVFEGQLFPIDSFDDFAKQWVPRWPNHESIILDAYAELTGRLGKSIVVAHSQGAGFAAAIGQRLPDALSAVIAIEPGGMPGDLPLKKLCPHLIVWGDHIDAAGQHWIRYRQQANDYLTRAGDSIPHELLDLPARGITGNSHFPMMDTNSDTVFKLVMDWIEHRL